MSEAEALPPPPEDAKVIVSVPAFWVIVILLPATNVKVSVAESATIFDCPETAIVLNASLTVPVPGIVIVLVEPVPVAVTPAPTKLIVPAAVDNAEPSSCTVMAEPPPEAAIVIVSVLAFVVNVIFEPAAKVNVSVTPSATISDCPLTAIVSNKFWFAAPDKSAAGAHAEPFHFNT